MAACLAGTLKEKVGAEAAPWKYHPSPDSEQVPLCNFDLLSDSAIPGDLCAGQI